MFLPLLRLDRDSIKKFKKMIFFIHKQQYKKKTASEKGRLQYRIKLRIYCDTTFTIA